MKYEGSYQFPKTSREVYEYVSDLKRVSECIPDLKNLELKSQDEALATVRAGIGFIRGDFTLRVSVTKRVPTSELRYTIHGSGLGSAVDMDLLVSIAETEQGGSTLKWSAETKIVGRIASMAQGTINSEAEKLIKRFFECLSGKLR